jgi:hypothetical protein
MDPTRRSRLLTLLWLGVVIVLGLGSRHRGMPELVVQYAGDVLWGTMFFLLYSLLWPRKQAIILWIAAVVTTEGIEVSELYKAPWILSLRATAMGGLLLGHEFSWSDVICVVIGASLGALFDRARAWSSRRGLRRRVAS